MIKDIWDIGKDVYMLFRNLDGDKRTAIRNYMLKKWKGVMVIIAVIVIPFQLHEYMEHRPERIIHAFYESLNRRAFNDAWGLLSKGHQERKWGRRFEEFEEGYEELIHHEYVKIKLLKSNQLGVKVLVDTAYRNRNQDNGTTEPERECLITQLQQENIANDYDGPFSVILGRYLLDKDWRIVLNNKSNLCD